MFLQHWGQAAGGAAATSQLITMAMPNQRMTIKGVLDMVQQEIGANNPGANNPVFPKIDLYAIVCDCYPPKKSVGTGRQGGGVP